MIPKAGGRMGPRVLITREEAEPFAALLRARGATPVHLPLIALRPTGAPAPGGPPPDVVLVTSAAAVRVARPFFEAWRGPAVAVGAATAAALEAAGVGPVEVGDGGGDGALGRLPAGRVWFIGAAAPAPALAAALRRDARIIHWAVYEQEDRPPVQGEIPSVDVLTLGSPSAAAAWARGPAPPVPAVTIGPTTTAAARALGLRVVAEAARPSLEAWADAAVSGPWPG